MAEQLSQRDRNIIAFERWRWPDWDTYDLLCRDLFDLPPIRYAQVLNALLGQPAALEYDAQVVRRLRRLRQLHRSGRAPIRDPRHR